MVFGSMSAADVASTFGFLDQVRDEAVERPPARNRHALHGRIPPDAQQQGDVRQLSFQHRHRAPHEHFQSFDGWRIEHAGLLSRLGPSVQGTVESHPEEFFLAGDVVVDRGLRDAETLGQVVHARSVVAALVEEIHGDAQHRLEVVARAAAAARRIGSSGSGHVPLWMEG